MQRKPTPYFGDYPADYRDFIIIDECQINDEETGEGFLGIFSPAVQLSLLLHQTKDNVDTYKYSRSQFALLS
jgi:type I restriction enzyme R subunit